MELVFFLLWGNIQIDVVVCGEGGVMSVGDFVDAGVWWVVLREVDVGCGI